MCESKLRSICPLVGMLTLSIFIKHSLFCKNEKKAITETKVEIDKWYPLINIYNLYVVLLNSFLVIY